MILVLFAAASMMQSSPPTTPGIGRVEKGETGKTQIAMSVTVKAPPAIEPYVTSYHQCLQEGVAKRKNGGMPTGYELVAATISACKPTRASAFADAQKVLDSDPVPSTDRHAAVINGAFDALESSLVSFAQANIIKSAIDPYRTCLGDNLVKMQPFKTEEISTIDQRIITACGSVRAQSYSQAEQSLGDALPAATKSTAINGALGQLESSFAAFVEKIKEQAAKSAASSTK